MKRILASTLLLAATLLAAPSVVDAQASTTRSSSLSLSQANRQQIVTQFLQDLRDITSANLDQATRSFLITTLLESLTQTLNSSQQGSYTSGSSSNSGSSSTSSISSRDYDRVVDAVEDYIRDEENTRDFDIDSVRRRGTGYVVTVDLDRYCTAEVELDRNYNIGLYVVACEGDSQSNSSNNREDNSDNPYLDDTTRTYNDRIEFRVTFDVEADRRDIYISNDIEDVLEFDIQDDRQRSVADETDLGSSRVYGRMDSSARESSGYYRIEEDETEEITFIITYETFDDDEYRLQLNELAYNDSSARPADSTLRFRSGSYVTEYYRID